ncbi:MAG: PE domain-containing protein [Pseudonocardia sp.]
MTQPDEPSHPLVPPIPPLEVGPRSDGGSALWIEPDAAQGVIDELRLVAKDVHEQAARCARAYVAPHAGDEVSRNAAAQANVMADRARDFCLAWHRQLHQAADRLTEQLRAYRAVEDENRRRLA